MKASYHNCTKYKTLASILFQLSELDLKSFKKLLFPRSLFSRPNSSFWKLSLFAAWWKFLLQFLTKNYKIWLTLMLPPQLTVFCHSSTGWRYQTWWWSRAGTRSNRDWGFKRAPNRVRARERLCSWACPCTGSNWLPSFGCSAIYYIQNTG